VTYFRTRNIGADYLRTRGRWGREPFFDQVIAVPHKFAAGEAEEMIGDATAGWERWISRPGYSLTLRTAST